MFGRKRRLVEKEPGRISPFLIRKKQTGVCEAYHLSQLRIVLLGESGAGKSSAGNTILGRDAFQVGGGTGQSLRGKGEVEGREVSVVDTPGWGGSVGETAEAVRRELQRSLSLCPSGPHAFLLAVPAAWSLFTEPQRRAAQEHLALFGEGVWRHTILLFTKGDRLGEASVQQQVERRGRDLQQLAEACRGRCHALSSKATPTRARQVTELLEKIERMVVANDGWHYKPQMLPPAEWEGKGEGEGERVLQRRANEAEEPLRHQLEEKEREVEEVRRRYKQKTKVQEEEWRKRAEELKLIFEERQKKREAELKFIFEEQQKNREEQLKLIFQEKQKNREEEFTRVIEEQQKKREDEIKLNFEEQQKNREEELKLIYEEQQKNREEEFTRVIEEQQKNRKDELKLIFEEQQKKREEEFKLIFEKQQKNREEELKVNSDESRRSKEALKEEWRKGEEFLRMTIKETSEKERGGVLPTGSRGNMDLDPAAERLHRGGAAVPVNQELRLAQVGEAKTRSSAAGKAVSQETETWSSSSDWFHRAGLVNTEEGRDAGCHGNLLVRAPRPICVVPVVPYLGGEELGQISREADSGCRPALIGELIPMGGEDLKPAAGMHNNGDQVVSNGNLGDCGRVPKLPGEEAQEEVWGSEGSGSGEQGGGGGRGHRATVTQGQTESCKEVGESGKEKAEEREEEQIHKQSKRKVSGLEVQDQKKEREVKEWFAVKPYRHPVAMVLGAVIGAVAGALRGAVGGTAAGAAIGAAVGAQLMTVLGGSLGGTSGTTNRDI